MWNASPGFAGPVHQTNQSWLELESITLHEGTLLPLYHRSDWAATLLDQTFSLVPVASTQESVTTSLLLQRHRSRILPGHTLLRVQRFGHGWPVSTWPAVVDRLHALATENRSTLRLNVEIFLRADHDTMRNLLTARGFTRVPARGYRHTLTLPVDQPDDVLLSTRKSLRKRLRDVDKAGAVVCVLTDAQYAPALTALQQTAMQRSGGHFQIQDWPSILKLSASRPDLSRVVGLFASADASMPGDLLGFAWGCMHGDHAEYRAAGAAELGPQHRGLSISHPLLWNLIGWTRDNGGTWFDMGGVTLKTTADDPLAGISTTKRVFTETVEEVGEEWMFEPRPWKGRLAQGLSSVAKRVRGKKAL